MGFHVDCLLNQVETWVEWIEYNWFSFNIFQTYRSAFTRFNCTILASRRHTAINTMHMSSSSIAENKLISLHFFLGIGSQGRVYHWHRPIDLNQQLCKPQITRAFQYFSTFPLNNTIIWTCIRWTTLHNSGFIIKNVNFLVLQTVNAINPTTYELKLPGGVF